MVRKSGFFVLLAIGSLVSAGASAQSLRDRQAQACTGDAFKLCGPMIPDEGRIEACMFQRRAELTPACRAFFIETTASKANY
jgi:hypothetical protein